MVNAEDAVIWINRETGQVLVGHLMQGRPSPGHWCDPIGAAYTQWRSMTNDQRARLMTETATDLAMGGFELKDVLVAFAQVVEFEAHASLH